MYRHLRFSHLRFTENEELKNLECIEELRILYGKLLLYSLAKSQPEKQSLTYAQIYAVILPTVLRLRKKREIKFMKRMVPQSGWLLTAYYELYVECVCHSLINTVTIK